MTITELVKDPRIQRIATHPDDGEAPWREDLDRLLAGDLKLDRTSASEAAVMAVQRLMIFLGYSTAGSGGFLVDGDFGRGTNRGIAQFQFEHGLNPRLHRNTLCYPCKWNTARKWITNIPDVRLDQRTLQAMLEVALERCESGQVMAGSVDEAIFHLNALHRRRFLVCSEIAQRYGAVARSVSERMADDEGVTVRPEWILAIVRQETAGVIRPRFEQHYLSRLNESTPGASLSELRMRSMSLGLGQIMGENFSRVGAPDATTLFTAPADEQVGFVARFLKAKPKVVQKADPVDDDFRVLARHYNGPKYEAHDYHTSLAKWFREFREILA
jgi:hypothetical protein